MALCARQRMGGKGALQVVFVVILLFHECVSEQPSDQLHPALSSNRKRLPIIDSPPLPVRIGFYLESLGNFRSTEMSFDVDLYLYLSWRDPALNHTEPDYVLIHDEKVKDELWLPDLYFANAKSAQFHTVTVPNFNMFIDQDGTVAYSTRVTLNVACNLNLMNYPLDHQLCLIKIISYAYIMTEMNVTWFSRDPIRYNPEIGLPEFAITDISHGYCDGTFDYTITEQKHRRAPFSCLLGNIRLKRSIGYHLVQSYIPTGLIVVISWVSFWIDRRAVPARVSLSFTTLLTMSTLGNGLRYALPPVSYAKAIDYWFGACMMFVFGALLEFAIVNSYMRRANKFDYLAQNMKWSKRYSGRGHDDMGDSPIPTLMTEVFSCPTTPEKKHFKQVKRELGRLGYDHLIHQAFRYSRKALMVDKRCRVVFPLAFITFNSLYWGYYLWMVEKYL